MKSLLKAIKKIQTYVFLSSHVRKLLSGEMTVRSSTLLLSSKIKGLKGNGLHMSDAYVSKSQILFKGKDNVVEINGAVYNTEITIKGTGNKLTIDPGVLLFNTKIVFRAEDSYVHIGSRTTVGSMYAVCMGKRNHITIGEDCMIAEDVEIWNTDSHDIYDKSSKELLNPSKPVEIGDNVWIGKRSTILKGVSIGSGVIIGYGSIVTKNVEPERMVVGLNKIVRENVEWAHKWTRG